MRSLDRRSRGCSTEPYFRLQQPLTREALSGDVDGPTFFVPVPPLVRPPPPSL